MIFKAILVDADEYLKQLSRYIHLNPVRAKIVEKPADYFWSSYAGFIGKAKPQKCLETEWLLSQFGRMTKTAKENYQDFVEGVRSEKLENPVKDLPGGFILGSQDFVVWVKERYLSSKTKDKEIPQLKELKPKIEVKTIVKVIADEYGCEEAQILFKGRKRNIPRDTAIYVARDLTGVSGVKLGEYFGNISGAGITVRYTHVSDAMIKNLKLKKKVEWLKTIIINN